MENDRNIDDHLRRTLESFEAQPGLGSFDAIIKKMQQKKRRRFFIIFFGTGLALILGALLYLFYLSPAEAINKTVAEKNMLPNVFSNHQRTHISKKDAAEKNAAVKPLPARQHATDSFKATEEKDKIINMPNALAMTIKKNNAAKASVSKTNKITFSQNGSASSLLLKKNAVATVLGNASLKDTLFAKSFNSPLKMSANPPADLPNNTNANSASFYLPLVYVMIGDSVQREIAPSVFTRPDSLLITKKKRKTNFYIGINLNPQWSSFAFSKNTHRNPIYDQNAGEPFSKLYLKNRKDQNTFRFNYAFGLKLGMVTQGGYEWLAGFGMQRYSEKEKLYSLANGPKAPSGPSNINNFSSAADPNMPYKNTYRYLYYSLECSRIFSFGMSSKAKIGFGLSAGNLLSASYISVKSPDVYYDEYLAANDLSKWLYTLHLKAGYIKDLNKRFQFQANPGIFYSATSMFNKSYVIRQKPIGFELECALLFKLF